MDLWLTALTTEKWGPELLVSVLGEKGSGGWLFLSGWNRSSCRPPVHLEGHGHHLWASLWNINPKGKKLCLIPLLISSSLHNSQYSVHAEFRWAEWTDRKHVWCLKTLSRPCWPRNAPGLMPFTQHGAHFTPLSLAIFTVASGRVLQVLRRDSRKSPLAVPVCYKAVSGSKVTGEHMAAAAPLIWVPGVPRQWCTERENW